MFIELIFSFLVMISRGSNIYIKGTANRYYMCTTYAISTINAIHTTYILVILITY